MIMIKKTAALFFILLANIILLAHAVAPHNHHNGLACICKTGINAHPQESSNSNHKHNGKNSSDYCILTQLIVVRNTQVKLECKNVDFTDNHSQFDGIQAILINNIFKVFHPIYRTNVHLPQIGTLYNHFVNTGLGLRAPPVV